MSPVQKSPTATHLLVCTHQRDDGRKSCSNAGEGQAVKDALKQAAKARGLDHGGQLRVIATSCLGLCAQGPNAIAQPQGQWFSKLQPEDAEALLDSLFTPPSDPLLR